MNGRNYEQSDPRIVQIERIIQNFKHKFYSGTVDPNDFITITEIELLWGELQNETNKIYSDMVRELMNDVDERNLIIKKKGSTPKKE